ncbi:MAG: hypothetical protein LBT92_03220 [Rickettsiales bacterium]|jgi:hypothetical protein|nr:hypothetical protein [Rickettsiales bacterium]
MRKFPKPILTVMAITLYSTNAAAFVPLIGAALAAEYAGVATILIAKHAAKMRNKLKPNFVKDDGNDVVKDGERTVGYGKLAETTHHIGVQIGCTPEIFGGQDPAGAYLGRCYDGLGRIIATEGEKGDVPMFSDKIRFGIITKAVVKNGATCENDTFGGDPIPGTAKECYIHGFKIAEEGGTIKY